MGGFVGFLWFVLHFAGYFIVISFFLMSCPNCIVLSDNKEGKEKKINE